MSGPSLTRRDMLVGAALLAVPGAAVAAVDAAGLRQGETFSREALIAYAKALAKQPYQAPDASLPSQFQDLDYGRYVDIRFRQERAIWRTESRAFVVEPLHRGFIYSAPVDLFTIEDGRVLTVAYDPSLFDFGKLAPPGPDAHLGYSGFRLKAAAAIGQGFEEFAIFQGASYFRAIARAQTYGTLGRGLAINTGDDNGEEFPFFRAFWIEKPQPAANVLVIHALLDSDSVAGAYRFTLRSGDVTVIDVEAQLIPRVKLDHVGIAPLNSMYFFGANDRSDADDVRLAVHEASGLQMWSGGGEWIWRPLQNPQTLQVSAFMDHTPKAFGLLQRNRDVAAFEDMDHRYERQPSVWVQPIGDWGDGTVQLVEIPSDAEIHDNIVSFWRPKDALEAGKPYSFAYRTSWCWSPPDRPPGAIAYVTRTGSAGGKSREFVIDFHGDVFADQKRSAALTPMVTLSPGKVRDVMFMPDPDRRIGRLSFTLDPDGETYSEMRAVLMEKDKPATETWLYRWTP